MQFKTVIFDFDSTLVTIEGIDELARLKGKYDQVSVLTKQAMDGHIPFADIFYRRLQLINPTHQDLNILAKHYLQSITPGAAELVRDLKIRDINTMIITGGYLDAVLPTAEYLGFTASDVYAISLKQDTYGYLTRIAENDVLIKPDGKKQCIDRLKPSPLIAFVGDGMTDAATLPSVNRFIGFAGVSQSNRLSHVSPYFTRDHSLLSVKQLLS